MRIFDQKTDAQVCYKIHHLWPETVKILDHVRANFSNGFCQSEIRNDPFQMSSFAPLWSYTLATTALTLFHPHRKSI